MPRTRRFWQAISVGGELLPSLAWGLLKVVHLDNLYNELNNNLFLYWSIIWLVFALIHGSVSYRSLRTAPHLWYKKWNLFWGLGDACLSVFCGLRLLSLRQQVARLIGDSFLEYSLHFPGFC